MKKHNFKKGDIVICIDQACRHDNGFLKLGKRYKVEIEHKHCDRNDFYFNMVNVIGYNGAFYT